MDQDALIQLIETRFAEADRENLRHISRELERLVRQVQDRALKSRYESALDQLPDMVAHLDEGH